MDFKYSGGIDVMDVSAVKSQIQQKKIDDYYIFTGPEWEVQKVYINQLSKVRCVETVRIDSVADVYTKLKNKSFINKPICYVVRDDKELMTNEKLQKQIDSGLLGGNVLIHLITSVDKRTKYYKAYKDRFVEFEPLNDRILMRYIKQKIDLSDKNCQLLINICEHDYGRILLEIDKIRRYVNTARPLFGYGKNSTEEDCCFEMLLNDGTIYVPPYDAVFDFVDTVLKRNINCAFDLLQQSYDSGEATLVLLSVLYNNVKALLQVQSCESKNKEKVTGLSSWQIKKVADKKGKYKNYELVDMLKLIQKVESGIKSGTMDEKIAVEYVLVRCI